MDFSVDLQVTDDAPTTFLAHATDDPIAPVENSLLMFAALRKVHVPVELHAFRSGGHGFNIGSVGTEDRAWAHAVCDLGPASPRPDQGTRP